MNLTRAFTLSLAASLLVGCQSHDDELASDYDRTAAYVEGVPGGAVLETETLLATVSAIDSSTASEGGRMRAKPRTLSAAIAPTTQPTSGR